MSREESPIDPLGLGLALLPQSQTDMKQEERTGMFDLQYPPQCPVSREECSLDPLALPLVRKADCFSDSVDLPLRITREKCEEGRPLVPSDMPLQTSVREGRHSTPQDIPRPTKEETEAYQRFAPLAQIMGGSLDPLELMDPLALTKREVTEPIYVQQVTSDLADPLYIPTQITTYLADPLCLPIPQTRNDFIQSSLRLQSNVLDPSPLPTQEIKSEQALFLAHPLGLRVETSRSVGLQFVTATADALGPLAVQSPQSAVYPLELPTPFKREAFDPTLATFDYVVTQATHPDAETEASTDATTPEYAETKVPLPLNCTATTKTTQNNSQSAVTESTTFVKSESFGGTVTGCSDEEDDADRFVDPLRLCGSADDGRDLNESDRPGSSTGRSHDRYSSTSAAMTVEQFETMRRQLLQQPFVRLLRLVGESGADSKSERQKGVTSESKNWKGVTSKSESWKGVALKSESRKGISTKSEIRMGVASKSKSRKGAVSKARSQPGAVSKASGQPGAVSKTSGQPGAVSKASGQPGAVSKASGQPGAVSKASGQPGAVSKASGQPGAVSKASGQPGAVSKASGQPGAGSKAALAAALSPSRSDPHLQQERMLPVVRLQRLTGPQLHNGYKRVCDQTEPVSHQDSPVKRIKSNSSRGKLPSVGRGSSKPTREKSRRARVLPRARAGEKRHKCGTCTKRFRNRSALQKHGRTHLEEPTHSCRVCGESFYVKSKLDEHKLTHAVVRNRPFGCNLCKRRFVFKCALRKHILAHINAPFKPFVCTTCGASYGQKCELQNHIIGTHSTDLPKKHVCLGCGKASKNAIALKRHLQSHCNVGTFECDACGKLYSKKKVLRYHIWKKHTAESEKPFPCDGCDQRFALKCWLPRHQLVHTGNRSSYTCDICKKQVFSKHGIYCHMLKHVGEKCFACSACDKRFYCDRNLKLHMRTHLNVSDRPYMCRKCGRRFNHSTGLSAHMYTHSKSVPKPFPCDMRFGLKSILERHSLIHRSRRDRLFPCNKCGKRFYTGQILGNHLKTHVHKTEWRFVCDVCGARALNKGNIANHMLSHADAAHRRYPCDQCGLRFNYKHRLRNHVSRKHSDGKLLTCAACSLQFYRKTQLAAHFAARHVVSPFACAVCDSRFNCEDNLRIHEAAHVKRPFACGECDKSYLSKHSLKRHMSSHSMRQPKPVFECDKCEKTYSSAAALRSHIVAHTSMFACKLCDKQYASKSSLGSHMLTHCDYDARRFACDVCGQRFNCNGKLTRHMLSHEDIKSRPFPCNFCDLRCIRREHLKIHLLTHANKSV